MTTPSSATRRVRALLAVLAVLVAPGFAFAADSLCQERGTPPADLVEKARASGAEFTRYQPLAVRGTVDVTPYKIAVARGLGAARGRGRLCRAAQRRAQGGDAGAAVRRRRHGRARAGEGRGHDPGLQDGDERLARRGRALHARAALPRRRQGRARVAGGGERVRGRGLRHLPHRDRDGRDRAPGRRQPARTTTCCTARPTCSAPRRSSAAAGTTWLRDGSRLDPKEFEEFQAFQWETPVETQEILAKCVRVYVEADYDIFQNKGSAAAVTNYVTGVFNQSAMLYANEASRSRSPRSSSGPRTSPYTSTLVAPACCRGSSRSATPSTATSATWSPSAAAAASPPASAGFCNSNIDNRQCFSGIQSSYANVPTYSWTVEVFTHEMGHLMGSRHTHACVWNGNNTAIDGCAAPEGTCARPGFPRPAAPS